MRSSAGRIGFGPPEPSVRSWPTAAAACWKPVPTRAAPLTRSGGSSPSDLRFKRLGDGLCHIEKLAPDLRVGDGVIQPDKLDRLRTLQVLAPLAVFRADLGIVRPQVAKKVRDRHPQDFRHRRQPRRAYAVGAAFVFLHLLKRQ